MLNRRDILRIGAGGLAATVTRGVRAEGLPLEADAPIVLVHGNGDHAALWQTVVWRFESNGYPPGRLFPINFTDPMARDDDSKPQPSRSSTDDQLRELSSFVDDVLKRTGADKVALVGNSRGGNSIRNFTSNAQNAAKVGRVVLCGVPNHGVFAWDGALGNEFNGRGPFLSRLNAMPGEIAAGAAWLTLRSDGLDKYAQPDGRFLGKPGVPTNVGFDGPALKGATNLVLGALDHRETAYHPRAFREIYKFIVGAEPSRIAIEREPIARIGGLVTGMANGVATNRPVAGAQVEIYVVAPESGARRGEPVYRKSTDATGAWGPAAVPTDAPLEFVVSASGYPTTHIYRSAIPRSSSIMHLRPSRPLAATEHGAGSVTVFSRPRGYFGLPRDILIFDGREPADVKSGVPTDSVTTLRMPEFKDRPVVCDFNAERIVCRPWPAQDGHMTIAELTG